jgi:hypothetical protein
METHRMRMTLISTSSSNSMSSVSQVMARLVFVLMPTLLMTAHFLARAQSGNGEYPNKPVRIVVTFPPGGSSDAVVRLLIPRLNEKLGLALAAISGLPWSRSHHQTATP